MVLTKNQIASLISISEKERLDRSILDLDLSVRTTNCLERAGIETVRELAECSEERLLRIRAFGVRCLEEVKDTLNIIGLNLGTPQKIIEDKNSPYSAELADFQAARDLGYITPEEIAEATGRPVERVYFFADRSLIPSLTKNQITRLRVKRAFYEGERYATKISEISGASQSLIKKVLAEIPGSKYYQKLSPEERRNKIRQLVSEGITDVNELSAQTGLNPSSVKHFGSKNNLTITGTPKNFQEKNRPEIDDVVEQGLTLEEMGNPLGVSGERVRQYLHATGQHETWKKVRKDLEDLAKETKSATEHEESERNNLVGRLISAVKESKVAKTREDLQEGYSLALKYAEKHHSASGKKVEGIAKFLERYFRARDDETKMSLKELAGDIKELGSNKESRTASASRILKELGYVSIIAGSKSRGYTRSTEEQKEIIDRSVKTPFGIKDIAYFIGIPMSKVASKFSRAGIKKGRPYVQRFEFQKKGERLEELNYRLASQVYEAQDAGYFTEFSTAQVAELLDTSERVVNYALENRATIEKTIVRALRKMYPENNIATPYISRTSS